MASMIGQLKDTVLRSLLGTGAIILGSVVLVIVLLEVLVKFLVENVLKTVFFLVSRVINLR
jgi:hypothetical protein